MRWGLITSCSVICSIRKWPIIALRNIRLISLSLNWRGRSGRERIRGLLWTCLEWGMEWRRKRQGLYSLRIGGSLLARLAFLTTLVSARSRKRKKTWQFLSSLPCHWRKSPQVNNFPLFKISSKQSMLVENMCQRQQKGQLLLTKSAKYLPFPKSIFRNSQPCSSCSQPLTLSLKK